MRLRHRRRQAAFTLIELLVVIAIITILVGLLLGAVMSVRSVGEKTKARTEMNQFATSIGNFKNKMKVDYIPSRIVLRDDLKTYNLADPLERDSLTFLKTCWPNMDHLAGIVDWNGNGTVDGPVTLEGDQCLVFFLGGIRNSNGLPTGFSTNTKNPTTQAVQGAERIGPFAEFQGSRLTARGAAGAAGYYSYLDPWNIQPYAYFSSYGKPNLYNKYGSSDCTSLGVGPYWVTSGNYYNSNGFQIITAGVDGVFGPGPTIPATGEPGGADDMANFSGSVLRSSVN